MSVTLKEYCETSQSKFAESLRVLMHYAVFIDVDFVEFVKDEDGAKAHIQVMHSISSNDARLLLEVFDGVYWQITTSTEQCTYEVIFYLGQEWL